MTALALTPGCDAQDRDRVVIAVVDP